MAEWLCHFLVEAAGRRTLACIQRFDDLSAWTPDGKILFPRRRPGSKVAWEYQARRADVDHFNRDYRPELARGGTDICRLDPGDGSIVSLTAPVDLLSISLHN